MKSIAIIGMSLLTLGSFAQTQTAPAPQGEAVVNDQPTILFKSIKIERQNITYDSKEPFVFEFKNTGKTPVIITNVQTSCGCTAAEKPTEPIEPGKSSKIVVNYDTKRVGPFTKTITVRTNSSETPVVLTITGTVQPAPQAPVESTTPAKSK